MRVEVVKSTLCDGCLAEGRRERSKPVKMVGVTFLDAYMILCRDCVMRMLSTLKRPTK